MALTIRPTDAYQGESWNNLSTAWDGDESTYADRTNVNFNPSLSFGGATGSDGTNSWQSKGEDWDQALLCVRAYKTTATDDTVTIEYGKHNGVSYTKIGDLVETTSAFFGRYYFTAQLDYADFGGVGFPNIDNLRIRVSGSVVSAPDGSSTRIYDVVVDGNARQILRPVGDIYLAAWTPSPAYTEIDEVTPSDSDFIRATSASSAGYIASISTPALGLNGGTMHVLRVRAGRYDGIPSTAEVSFIVRSGISDTVHGTFTCRNLGVLKTFNFGFNSSDIDYSDLRITFGASVSQSIVTWLELDVPGPGIILGTATAAVKFNIPLRKLYVTTSSGGYHLTSYGQDYAVLNSTSPGPTIEPAYDSTVVSLALNPARTRLVFSGLSRLGVDGSYIKVVDSRTFLQIAFHQLPDLGKADFLKFSPDGSQLIVHRSDTTNPMSVYETSGWTVTNSIGSSEFFSDSVFSPDGSLLAVVSNNTADPLQIYNTSTWLPISGPATVPTAVGRKVAFSKNGKFLAVAFSGSTTNYVYNTSDWSVALSLSPASALSGWLVGFSEDSKLFAAGVEISSGTDFARFYVYNTASWTQITGSPKNEGQDDPANLLFSPVSRYLAVSHPETGNNDFSVYDLEDSMNKEIDNSDSVADIAWTPNGQHLITDSQEAVTKTRVGRVYQSSNWTLFKNIPLPPGESSTTISGNFVLEPHNVTLRERASTTTAAIVFGVSANGDLGILGSGTAAAAFAVSAAANTQFGAATLASKFYGGNILVDEDGTPITTETGAALFVTYIEASLSIEQTSTAAVSFASTPNAVIDIADSATAACVFASTPNAAGSILATTTNSIVVGASGTGTENFVGNSLSSIVFGATGIASIERSGAGTASIVFATLPQTSIDLSGAATCAASFAKTSSASLLHAGNATLSVVFSSTPAGLYSLGGTSTASVVFGTTGNATFDFSRGSLAEIVYTIEAVGGKGIALDATAACAFSCSASSLIDRFALSSSPVVFEASSSGNTMLESSAATANIVFGIKELSFVDSGLDLSHIKFTLRVRRTEFALAA